MDRKKLYHLRRGSRVLDDKRAEAVAYLLADHVSHDEIVRLMTKDKTEITAAEIKAYEADEWFSLRVQYLLKAENRRKKNHPPQQPDHD